MLHAEQKRIKCGCSRVNFCILCTQVEAFFKVGKWWRKKMRGVNNGLAIVLELAGMHDPDPGAEIYRCRKLADLCPVAPASNIAHHPLF